MNDAVAQFAKPIRFLCPIKPIVAMSIVTRVFGQNSKYIKKPTVVCVTSRFVHVGPLYNEMP
jgi:hypothetical protein